MFVKILTIILILIVLHIYFESVYYDITTQKSDIDGKTYLVRDLPDKQSAANNIAIVKNKLKKVVDYFKTNKVHLEDSRVQTLIENFQEDVLAESPKWSKHTSYTVNKGEEIYFCLRQRDKNNNLVDLNTITFVALHELAHVMTKSVGHTKEFWENFRFLLKIAINLNVYTYHPYHLKPIPYCGTIISDTPLKSTK